MFVMYYKVVFLFYSRVNYEEFFKFTIFCYYLSFGCNDLELISILVINFLIKNNFLPHQEFKVFSGLLYNQNTY